MSRTRISILVLAAGMLAAMLFGTRLRALRDEHEAAALIGQAEALLGAPLEEAPSLGDLRATDARNLSQQANAIAPSPRADAMIALAHALEALARDDQAAAQTQLERMGRALDDFAPAFVVRAELSLRRDEREQAWAQLQRALAIVNGQGAAADSGVATRVLASASDVARLRGSGEEALALAERGLALDARGAALYEKRGLAHELLGDLPAARSDLERASRLDARAARPLVQLGRVLHAMGDPRAAELAFRGALGRDASLADAYIGSGVCRNELGDPVGARVDFEEAIARDATHAEPQLALGDLDVAQGELASALTRYRRAVELDKRNPTAWVKLGNALVRENAGEQAALAFRAAIDLSPDLAQAHNGLGAALLMLGRGAAGEIELGTAINLAPRDPNPWRMLAMARRMNGDLAGAQSAQAEADARVGQLELAQQPHAPAQGI